MNLPDAITFSDDGTSFGLREPEHRALTLSAVQPPIVVFGETVTFSPLCCSALAFELLEPGRCPALAAHAYRVPEREQTARAPAAHGWLNRDAIPARTLAALARGDVGVTAAGLAEALGTHNKTVRSALKSLLARGFVIEVLASPERLWKASPAGKAEVLGAAIARREDEEVE